MNHNWTRWILLVVVVTGIGVAITYRDQFDATALEQWIQDAGLAGPLLFMVIYALGTVLFLPGSVLTLAGGALFGPVLGTIYNLTGATIGATLAFLVARYLASEWVEGKTGGRLKQLKHGVEGEGWRFVAFVRLVPLFPFNLLNYALGLTRIKLVHYIIASYLCMLPGAIAYTYLGYAGREAVAGSEGLIQKGLIALALLASAAFFPRLIKGFSHASMFSVETLKNLLDQHQDVYILDVRTTTDFVNKQGHIPHAHNIPVEELPQRLEELASKKKHPIAIVCTTEKRSKKAAKILAKLGFADTHIVKGGMMEWNRMGYHVER